MRFIVLNFSCFSLCLVFFENFCFYLCFCRSDWRGKKSPTTLKRRTSWLSARTWRLLGRRFSGFSALLTAPLFPAGHHGAAGGRGRRLPAPFSSFPVACKQGETNSLRIAVCLQLALEEEKPRFKVCVCLTKRWQFDLSFLKRIMPL